MAGTKFNANLASDIFHHDPCGHSRLSQQPKRLIDLILAGVGVIALLPIMVAITALLYGLGFNRPIFTQQRVGQGGRVFTIFKFRTLHDQTCRPVSRLTSRLAKAFTSALRISGFDELPQLFNIMSGDMSLVGPRPHSLADHVLFSNSIAGYDARLTVKPGITGWAQICGWRGPVMTIDDLTARIAHDLVYIRGRNMTLDTVIVIITVLLPFLSLAKVIRRSRPTGHRFIQCDRQCDGRIA